MWGQGEGCVRVKVAVETGGRSDSATQSRYSDLIGRYSDECGGREERWARVAVAGVGEGVCNGEGEG